MPSKEICDYLNRAGEGYLDSINGNSPESLISTQRKFSHILKYLENPKRSISLGVGQGEEAHALDGLYNTDVFGLDISILALNTAKQRALRNNYEFEPFLATVQNLPFTNNTFDLTVLSAILHEVYSYSFDSDKSFIQTLNEASRITAKNGIIVIRDAIVRKPNEIVNLKCNTQIAQNFYNYFRTEYCKYNAMSEDFREKISKDKFTYTDAFLEMNKNGIELPFYKVAELLLHFRNFYNDFQKQNTAIGDIGWKEINERYFIPKPNETISMSPTDYVETIIAEINDKNVICMYANTSSREKTSEFLTKHFELTGDVSNIDLINRATNKLEVILKKV
mgnify:CR=1 FL=1